MMHNDQQKNSILSAVHETAFDLHQHGFISQRTMNHYEALCVQPIPVYSSDDIRTLRERFKLSQTVFASVLNISASTVRKWEQGDKQPSGPSLKLLNLLDRKGLAAVL